MIADIVEAIKGGHKILIAGNGGLAAEAEHFAAELMGKYAFDVYVPCIALTTNSSLLTALANDMGFENVFSHQVAVLGQPGDVFIGMTTSASANILRACEVARAKGMDVWLFDKKIVPGHNTATMQQGALELLHRMAFQIKRRLNVSCQPE